MKTNAFILSIIGVLILATCNNSVDESINHPEDTKITISEYSYSGCLNNSRSTDNIESIHLKMQNNGQLLIEHKNVFFNCSPDTITLSIKTDSTYNIEINEDEVNPMANCICPYNLECIINGIKSEDYFISISQGDIEKIKINLDFSNDIDTLINLSD